MATFAPAEILRVHLVVEATGESRREATRPATLCIENNGEEPLMITRVKHLLPSGVTLVATSDSYLHREQTYSDLCQELRLLIQDEYFFSNPELIATRKKEIVQLINEAMLAAAGSGVLSKIFRVWQVVLSPLLAAAAFRRWQDRFNANQLVIEGYQDALIAWELVTSLPVPENQVQARNRDLIELKLKQLKELENERTSQGPGRGHWTVEAHSTHSEAMILKCDKSVLSVRRYPVVIEVTATSSPGAQPLMKRASSSIEVPPKDLPLASLAMLCAPLGFISRLVVQSPKSSFDVLLTSASLPRMVIAAILGFLLCVTFERLRWGNSDKLSLSWRTAVLLGFAAGLATENLLGAIQAFFGIS